MNELRQVTFGKRKHPVVAEITQPATKIWPVLILAAAVVSFLGALGVPMFLRQPVADHAETFLEFSAKDPELAKRHVLASIEPCLSDGARPYWSDPTVMTFAAEVLSKALSLKYADLSPDQRDTQFREWIGPAASDLTLDQQTQFRGLMNNGLHKADTGECLAAKVHGLMQS